MTTNPIHAARPRVAVAALAVMTVMALPALAACGGSPTAGEAPGGGPATSAAEATGAVAHNAADITFAQMMIPHHQQALELADLVPGRSDNAAVITLASTISAEQQPEIDTMRALLAGWDVDPDAMPGGHAGHGGMDGQAAGMVDEATMARLGELQGQPFDELWLTSMISHHQGAVEMARVEVADGRNDEMVALARGVITAQQSEIAQMQRLLDEGA